MKVNKVSMYSTTSTSYNPFRYTTGFYPPQFYQTSIVNSDTYKRIAKAEEKSNKKKKLKLLI